MHENEKLIEKIGNDTMFREKLANIFIFYPLIYQ